MWNFLLFMVPLRLLLRLCNKDSRGLSAMEPFAAAACVMEDEGRECFISNKVIAPGGPTEM